MNIKDAKPELVAPAGNFEKLKIAFHYGADAVYLGMSEFSLRAKSDNFTLDGLKKAADFVRINNKKFYITLNIFTHNRDISPIKDHLNELKKISIDGIVVSDVGVFEMVSEIAPEFKIHISTQANITNYRSAIFWERLGAKRLILSRELSINEIREIRDRVSIDIECFIHGAICISYSGRCYLSSFLASRSANRGECTNSCRWGYALMEEKRKGEYLQVYENDRGAYVLSPRDLCMIEYIDKLFDAGVNSFKIEGRMKGINYVAGVINIYREAIDSLKDRPYQVKDKWIKELSMVSNRGYTTGMFLGRHSDDGYNHDEEEVYRRSHELVGVVESVCNSKGVVALRNNLRVGDRIEFLSRGLKNNSLQITEILDTRGISVPLGRNEDTVSIAVLDGVRKNDLIRRII